MQTPPSQPMIRTNIPFRLDRLPWSRFHLLVGGGLGITWILDGLDVTIVGSLGPALQSADTLHLSSANLGAVASFYVVGAVVGALVFGWITARHRRGIRRGQFRDRRAHSGEVPRSYRPRCQRQLLARSSGRSACCSVPA